MRRKRTSRNNQSGRTIVFADEEFEELEEDVVEEPSSFSVSESVLLSRDSLFWVC